MTPLTKRVIRTLQKRDVIFYIATGRMYNLGRVISRQINDDVRIVASNGAVFENGHQMNKHYLGKKSAQSCLRSMFSRSQFICALFLPLTQLTIPKKSPSLLRAMRGIYC